ncbi:MAG: hypothetical protein HFG62_19550 [Lachnospiraceae bacterium]|jgi:hypothetical protein|nr:hypothetical protein [Lachnospiraceae bacterium]
MASIASSLLLYSVKVIVFGLLAYAGIMGGKKFRDSRSSSSQNAGK